MKLCGRVFLCCLFALPASPVFAQGTVPTFTHTVGHASYTTPGQDPAKGQTTTIPTVLVPVKLTFEAGKHQGQPFVMDAINDVASLRSSPVFSKFNFAPDNNTQYADAMLRASFVRDGNFHTLLGDPEIKPLAVTVPVGYGYILTSKKTGGSLAVVDAEFLQKEIFKQLPRQPGKLVIALTENVTYYSDGDATECCSWGTHGVDQATGNSFVLASYLRHTPKVVQNQDVQPVTQQLAEFVNDPLHDPLFHGGESAVVPGNRFPGWLRLPGVPAGDQGRCGGTGAASMYFLLEPTDTNDKNQIPASPPYEARIGGTTFHLQNVALLPWYAAAGAGLGITYSFPDKAVLASRAAPCPPHVRHAGALASAAKPAVAPVERSGLPNGHQLIGYWEGYGSAKETFPVNEIAPQWDVVIVAFATPAKNAPEGTMQFHPPTGIAPEQFKAEIAELKSQGRKVLISLGGGGQHFTLADSRRVPAYVSTVSQIVSEYGFDGIDIDFESPSLSIDPGDIDFKHPATPSIVNLISALRQLHDHFGSGFMISLVPEGTQIPSGYPSYGGQFGSYLAITYAIRDILSFIDVQDYNTPPLEGLDGEIYQPGSVDYHAAMTELLLHGFNVGGDPAHFFPPLPSNKVAIGFLTPDTTPGIVGKALNYIITGKAPQGSSYTLRQPGGYPGMIGAMFWTINDDRRNNYNYSNHIGPQLHEYPAAK